MIRRLRRVPEPVIGSPVVADEMRKFFKSLTRGTRRYPNSVGRSYARHFWYRRQETSLLYAEAARPADHYVSLRAADSDYGLADLTKRLMLVSDVLLMSDDYSAEFTQLSQASEPTLVTSTRLNLATAANPFANDQDYTGDAYYPSLNSTDTHYGIHCPDTGRLGRWLLNAERLMRAGSCWYLPAFSTYDQEIRNGRPQQVTDGPTPAFDFLIRGRKAVAQESTPVTKSKIVRPIIEIDLPFVDNVSMRDYAEIMTHEIPSAAAFKDFLRERFLDIEPALESEQSQIALAKLGIEIRNGLRDIEAQLQQIRTKRAFNASGAVIGTVTATLVAIYGPALAAAVPVLGAAGGLWQVLQSYADNDPKQQRSDKWYFVWNLVRASEKNNL